MWNGLALGLSKKWVTANQASILSLFVIIPLFLAIYFFVDLWIWYWGILFLAINIKLILNAIDWIIAQDQGVSTQLWRYLNVGTDIAPDILIIYLLLLKIGTQTWVIYALCSVILLYLLWEFLYIYLYKKQNLFFGKETRVAFYVLLFLIYIWGYSMMIGLYIYFVLFIIHNVWFFRK